MEIAGNSSIEVGENPDKALEFRVKAASIHLNLAPGGSFTVKKQPGGCLPLMAEKELELGEDNRIVIPKNGKVATATEAILGPDCKVIRRADTDELAEEIQICNLR